MMPSNWVAPAILFFAGAVFGRVFGVKPLVKGAITAATMTGMLPDTSSPSRKPSAPARRRSATARKKVARKRSPAAA